VVGLALLGAACGSDGDEAEAAPVVVIDGESAADGTESTDLTATDADGGPTNADDTNADGTSGGEALEGEATDEELALEFAQCMRDNGIPNFPDPAVNADGSIELVPGGAQQAGIDPDDDDLDPALDACGPIVAGASFLPGADLDQSEIEDSLLAFAQCLRDLGHDVADPDLSGPLRPGPDGPGGMFASGFDPQDPACWAPPGTSSIE
ncbi:MAG: hypothetical protein AAGK32_22440, partial [Actinomycetota bacterium]